MTHTLERMRTPVIIALALLLAVVLALALVLPASGISWASTPEDMNVAGASWSNPMRFFVDYDGGYFSTNGASWS